MLIGHLGDPLVVKQETEATKTLTSKHEKALDRHINIPYFPPTCILNFGLASAAISCK